MKAPPAPAPRFYTTAEAAALLHIHPDTLTRAHEEGKLPESAVFRTPGGHRRFSAGYIEDVRNGGRW